MKVPKARRLPSGAWTVQLRLGGESISITRDTEKEAVAEAMAYKAGIMKAKKKPLEELELDDLDIDEDDVEPKTNVVEIFLPPTKAAGRVLEGELPAQEKELVSLLQSEAKVI